MSRKIVLSRRFALRGLIGGAAVAVALPPLEAMLDSGGRAFANGDAIPRRFGLFYWGNGVKQEHFLPSSTGTGWQAAPPASLAPFVDAGLAKYVSIVGNTEVPFLPNWAHWTPYRSMMSGCQPLDENGVPDYQSGQFPSEFGGKTIIELCAEGIGASTKLPSMQVRVSRAGYGFLEGEPEASEHNPQALWAKLFAGFTPDAEPLSPAVLAARKSVLDAVAEDTRALQKILGGADKQRLEAHLASIASVEKSITALPDPSCTLPTQPGPRPADLDGMKEPLEEVHEAMAELTAYALACDLTRVVDYTYFQTQATPVFWQVGVSQEHHTLGHDEPEPQPQVQKTVVFIMQQLAVLASKLQAIPVGDGNLLDHTCLWGTSEIADPSTHDFSNTPNLVIGKAGGNLEGGVYHDANGAKHGRLSLTMMRAVGVDIDSFGEGDGYVDTTMPEIEAG